MTGTKTNERPGTRAVVRNVRMSATKARVVLDLIRNSSVDEARDVLTYTERGAAAVVGKCLNSAIANAVNNDQIDPETLFVSACYADEGRTLYRFRPRARGRATRIRKRTCHITIIVSPMSAEMLAIEQAKREAIPGSRASRRRGQEAASRAARVAASQETDDTDEIDDDLSEEVVDEVVETEETVETDDTSETTDESAETTESDASAEASEPSASEAPDGDDDEGSVQRDSEDSIAGDQSETDEGDTPAEPVADDSDADEESK